MRSYQGLLRLLSDLVVENVAPFRDACTRACLSSARVLPALVSFRKWGLSRYGCDDPVRTRSQAALACG